MNSVNPNNQIKNRGVARGTSAKLLNLCRDGASTMIIHPMAKKKTLQEAAKFVGVSKKSLDDYYYQLRIGEKHDFDFAAHFEDKIGALRAFIKTK